MLVGKAQLSRISVTSCTKHPIQPLLMLRKGLHTLYCKPLSIISVLSLPNKYILSILDQSEVRLNSNLSSLMANSDSNSHFYESTVGSGEAILTFLGSVSTSTGSLPLTDIAHHHLAIGVLLVWYGHLYSSLSKALGHRISSTLKLSSTTGLSLMIIRSVTYN